MLVFRSVNTRGGGSPCGLYLRGPAASAPRRGIKLRCCDARQCGSTVRFGGPGYRRNSGRRVSRCPRIHCSVETANPGDLADGGVSLEGTGVGGEEEGVEAIPSGVALRECTREELEGAARLRAEAYYEDSRGRYVETFKRHFVRQETDSLRSRTTVTPNGFPECVCLVAVAEGSGQVVGTLDIRPPAGAVGSTRLHRDGRYLNGVPEGVPQGSYVLNVCVSEEWRGRGIGTALMRRACGEARRRWGAEQMFTEVDTWNDSAYSLYRRVGFRRFSPDGAPLPAATPGARARHMLHLDLSQAGTERKVPQP